VKRPAASEADLVAALRARSRSPHAPEPPRAHPVVTWVAGRAARAAGGRRTPHLCGGSDTDKTRYEYAEGPAFLETIGPWLPPSPMAGHAVLDVGCGWGGKAVYVAEILRPERVEGFDLPGVFDPQVPLRFATERGVSGCGFRTGFAEAIPYADAEFDLLVCEDVLEHVESPRKVLTECHRVLRPGGLLVALFPSFRMLDAHHLDRAVTWPGLQYLFSMKTWAAGLNAYLIDHPDAAFEPFSEAIATSFHRCVTRDLNGMGLQQFAAIADESGLERRHLGLIARPTPENGRSRFLKSLYRTLCRVPGLDEVLAQRVIFVGRRPA
jgi:2-polyprenyl-3-methyl-5-hydroxy-6-metoxy-1,4-benzoquinol methylase